MSMSKYLIAGMGQPPPGIRGILVSSGYNNAVKSFLFDGGPDALVLADTLGPDVTNLDGVMHMEVDRERGIAFISERDDDQIAIVDFSDPTDLVLHSNFTVTGLVTLNWLRLSEDKNTLLIKDGSGSKKLISYDVSDLSSPTLLSTFTAFTGYMNMYAQCELGEGDIYYDSGFSGRVGCVDLSDPSAPVMLDTYNLVDTYAVTIIAHSKTRQITLFLHSQTWHAFDVSDPSDMVHLGSLNLYRNGNSDWENAVISEDGNTLYFVSDRRIDIVDITDCSAMSAIGTLYDTRIKPGKVLLHPDEEYLYSIANTERVRVIFDVSDKTTPTIEDIITADYDYYFTWAQFI